MLEFLLVLGCLTMIGFMLLSFATLFYRVFEGQWPWKRNDYKCNICSFRR